MRFKLRPDAYYTRALRWHLVLTESEQPAFGSKSLIECLDYLLNENSKEATIVDEAGQPVYALTVEKLTPPKPPRS